MKARGNVLRLLRLIGKMQDAIGKALGAAMNDRDPQQADHIQDNLRIAFDLCVKATSMYDPVKGE